jgi:hypothetical protein
MADNYLNGDTAVAEKGESISPQEVKKKTNLWHERISVAKKYQKDCADRNRWETFINEYKGKFELYFKDNIPVPAINDVYSYVQSDIANTNFRDPYITVNPKRETITNPGTIRGAALREAWINYKWRELKSKQELELEIMDKDLVGHAWHKVGMHVQSVGSGDTLRIMDAGLYSMRVSWRDIFFNIGSLRPPIDCVWMAQRIVRPLMDMKELYPQVALKLKGVQHPYLEKSDYQKATFKDDIEVGISYEIWDAREKLIYMIAEGLPDDYLEDPKPWPEYMDEFPFLMYWDLAIPDEAYPMSAIAPWEKQVLEKMVVLGQAVQHVKRWNRQLLVTQGTINPEALDKFEKGYDGAIIEVTGQGDINQRARFMDFGQLPPDFYAIIDRFDQIARVTNGQPEIDKGGVTKTQTRTVGELNLIKEGAKSRTDRKIDRFETHQENIARQMMAHFEGNFDTQMDELVKVTGETPENIIQAFGDHYDETTGTIRFTPEDIKGEYDIEVKAGSTLPIDKATRSQILETFMETVLPLVAQMGLNPLVAETTKEYLKEYDMPGLSLALDQMLEAKAQSEEAESQAAQMEQAKTASETEKRTAQAHGIDVDTALKQQEHEMKPQQEMHDQQMDMLKAVTDAKKADKPPPKSGGK